MVHAEGWKEAFSVILQGGKSAPVLEGENQTRDRHDCATSPRNSVFFPNSPNDTEPGSSSGGRIAASSTNSEVIR